MRGFSIGLSILFLSTGFTSMIMGWFTNNTYTLTVGMCDLLFSIAVTLLRQEFLNK